MMNFYKELLRHLARAFWKSAKEVRTIIATLIFIPLILLGVSFTDLIEHQFWARVVIAFCLVGTFAHLLLAALRDWYLQERSAIDAAIRKASDDATRAAVSQALATIPKPIVAPAQATVVDHRRQEASARLERLRSELIAHAEKAEDGMSRDQLSGWVGGASQLLQLVNNAARRGFKTWGVTSGTVSIAESAASLRKVAIALSVDDLE